MQMHYQTHHNSPILKESKLVDADSSPVCSDFGGMSSCKRPCESLECQVSSPKMNKLNSPVMKATQRFKLAESTASSSDLADALFSDQKSSHSKECNSPLVSLTDGPIDQLTTFGIPKSGTFLNPKTSFLSEDDRMSSFERSETTFGGHVPSIQYSSFTNCVDSKLESSEGSFEQKDKPIFALFNAKLYSNEHMNSSGISKEEFNTDSNVDHIDETVGCHLLGNDLFGALNEREDKEELRVTNFSPFAAKPFVPQE